MFDPHTSPGFVVWRQDDNGARSIVGACNRKSDALSVVETLEARGHKQYYWIEENGEATPRTVPILLAAPPLAALGRVVAPPVRLAVEPPWLQAKSSKDPAGSIHFERPPGEGEGAAELVLSGLSFDVPVSFEDYVDYHWSSAGSGRRRYTPEALVRSQFGGRPARGRGWETGVSEIFAWLIQVTPRLLVWAACEVYLPCEARNLRDARDVSSEVLSGLAFLDQIE